MHTTTLEILDRLGIAPRLISLKNFTFFVKDYFVFNQLSKHSSGSALTIRDLYPCLADNTANTSFDRHYIYHPAWAARILAQTKPTKHIDISSTLHFCSIVSAFIPVDFYDYRPAQLNLSNLKSQHVDLLNLPFNNDSITSLSCMHTLEHIGLGRYGDPLDPGGDLKAMKELSRVLAVNGNLLIVVPMGKPRIQFNAHRIYSYDQIVEYFKDLNLKEFSLIPDQEKDGGLMRNASKSQADKQNYGCGCFWFRK